MSANTTMEYPRTHLLQLPVELRLRIFFYALEDPYDGNYTKGSSPVPDRSWIHCVLPKDSGNVHPAYYSYRGTELMSRLLRINKQSHDEIEKVLYTEFRFAVRDCVDAFLNRLSPKAVSLIRHIFVWHTIEMSSERSLLRSAQEDTMKFHTLAARLPGLRSVRMLVVFIGLIPVERRAELVNRIMKLLYEFRNVQDLKLLDSHDPTFSRQRMDVIKACQLRLAAKLWCE